MGRCALVRRNGTCCAEGMWKQLVTAVVLTLVLGVVVGLSTWLRPPALRARLLQRIGLGLMAVFTLIGTAWIAAEAFADPGGWQGALLVTFWLVPMGTLFAIVWYRTEWAAPILGVLTTGLVAACIWSAADPGTWQAFEDNHGPVRAIAVFALAAPTALLGWRRPLPAGVLLAIIGVAPFALSVAGGMGGLGSLGVVSLPPVLTAACYLLADVTGRRAASVDPVDRPKVRTGTYQDGQT